MPLNSPQSQTISVWTTEADGTKVNVPLNKVIAELAPNMCTPSIIDYIKNTRAVDTSKFADVDYEAIEKTSPTVTYKDGKRVIAPKDVTAQMLTINAVRLKPTQIIDKYTLKDIDDMTDPSYKNKLAGKIIEFQQDLSVNNEIILFNNLVYSAKQCQAKLKAVDAAAVTFDKGAHYVVEDLTTAEDIIASIKKAKRILPLMGKANAKTDFDANFKYARGITHDNLIILINEDIKDEIITKDALLASDAGNQTFRDAGITKILGLYAFSTNNLPEGVNYVITTVGKWGTIAFDKVADKDWFAAGPDPEWEKDFNLKMSREQVMGILFEQLIVASVSTEADKTLALIDKFGNTTPVVVSKAIKDGEETFALEGETKAGAFTKAKEAIKSTFTGSDKETTEMTPEAIQSELNRIKDKQAKGNQLSKVEIKFLEEHDTKTN